MVWSRQRHRDHRFLRRSARGTAPERTGRRTGDLASPLSNEAFVAGLRPIPSEAMATARLLPTTSISGRSPDGRPMQVTIDDSGPTLVAFLAAHCDGCETFWHGLGKHEDPILPARLSCVVVTRSPATADADQIARLSADLLWPVVMSEEAWADFQVMSYPVFVLIDGASRSVVAETVGFGWDDVLAMVASAG